jgi:hypothetical protein
MNVYSAGRHIRIVSPYPIQEHVAREDTAFVLKELFEQPELLGGQ